MKIFSAQQIKAWDQYTIQHEPIAPIDLMERAAGKCAEWILQQPFIKKRVDVFCGKGNNGGDGLAIARMLLEKGIVVQAYVLETCKKGSNDFEVNLQRLQGKTDSIHYIRAESDFLEIVKDIIVIDALYGSGLKGSLSGISAALANHINASQATIISVDVPSGLIMDASSKGNLVINADYTLTFECYKLSLLMAENAGYIGKVQVLPIGLHSGFLKSEEAAYELLDENNISAIYKPRNPFAHKGTYGHSLLIGGSYGKIGAIVLAAKACLRSGTGLTTVYLPHCGYHIIQSAAPEAMTITNKDEEKITHLPASIEKYSAIGIGPGLGTHPVTQLVIAELLQQTEKPLVLDADALNCLALNPHLLHTLPAGSLLTPHPKEFDRLFGESENEFERIALAQQKSKELGIIIVLKGHHSLIALPDGKAFFNSTGNAGMAKGGSGDVLTGILTSLLAQNYKPADAAILGVYLHGFAGDKAAEALSPEAMLPSDLIHNLSECFKYLNHLQA